MMYERFIAFEKPKGTDDTTFKNTSDGGVPDVKFMLVKGFPNVSGPEHVSTLMRRMLPSTSPV